MMKMPSQWYFRIHESSKCGCYFKINKEDRRNASGAWTPLAIHKILRDKKSPFQKKVKKGILNLPAQIPHEEKKLS